MALVCVCVCVCVYGGVEQAVRADPEAAYKTDVESMRAMFENKDLSGWDVRTLSSAATERETHTPYTRTHTHTHIQRHIY